MTPLQALKKVRRGLTNPKNFDGYRAFTNRPHCIIGEWRKVAYGVAMLPIFTTKEKLSYMKPLSHRRALQILDAAIRREEKRSKGATR